MAGSQAYTVFLGTGVVLVTFFHLNMGLLSDYKICGDSECESMMSRAQAIRDYHGKDCRFLSFTKGDAIFVYHKLTGKREDLWAGTIDKQFGYFPKEAVTEEHVHATVEKIVKTQESDFFCVDEFGYPTDSSHLDDDDNDTDEKIHIKEAETTPYPDDNKVGSPSISDDVSTKPAEKEHEKQNDSEDAGGTHEEAPENLAALNQQGGSHSSSWISSSVTGWLGLSKEEEAGNLDEGEQKVEIKEAPPEDSYTSSVKGWLGLGGEKKSDYAQDTENSGEEVKKPTDSFTSTMTGWLGFGGDEKTDYPTEEGHEEEREMEGKTELIENFRSRKMYLDLETNQLEEEEKAEMGTMAWLGNGLSSTLGFGLNNQQPEDKETVSRREPEETIQEEQQPASSSWFDLGIRDMLGFRKDNSEVVYKAETESDNTAAVNADTNVNIIDTLDGSKNSVLPEDDESKVDPKDNSPQTMLQERSQSVGGQPGGEILRVSDTDQDFVQQNNVDSESGLSSVDSRLIRQSVVEDEDSTKDPLQSKQTESMTEKEPDVLIRNISTTQSDESAEQSQVRGAGEKLLATTDSDTETKTNHNEVAQKNESHPVEGSSLECGSAYSTNKDADLEEETGAFSSNGSTPIQVSMDDIDIAAGSPQMQQRDTQSEGDVEQSKEKKNNLRPVQNEKETLGIEKQGGSKYVLDPETEAEKQEVLKGVVELKGERKLEVVEDTKGKGKPEVTEELNEEEKQVEERRDERREVAEELKEEKEEFKEEEKKEEVEGFKKEGKEMKEKKEEKREGIEELEEEEKQEEAEELKDESKDGEKQAKMKELEVEKQELEELIEEVKKVEEKTEDSTKVVVVLKEEEKKEEVEQLKVEDENKETEELKVEGKLEEDKDIKEGEKKEEVDDLKEEEKKEKVDDLKEEEKPKMTQELKVEKKLEEDRDIREGEKKDVVEDLKEEEKQEEVKKLEGEEKQEEVGDLKDEVKKEEEEDLKEAEKQEVVEKLIEDKRQEEEDVKFLKVEKMQEVEQLKEDKKQEGVEELKEREKQEEVEKLKEDKWYEEEDVKYLKVEKMQAEVEKLKEEEKQEEVEELKEDEKQEEVEKLKEEEKQEEVEKLKEDEKQEEVENLKEEEKQEEVEEKQQTKDVEDERRGKEEEERLECSDELCSQNADEFVRDREGHYSEDGHNPHKTETSAAKSKERQKRSLEGLESDNERLQHEENVKARKADVEADGRGKEQGENKNNEVMGLNDSKRTSSISDLTAVEVDQKGEVEHGHRLDHDTLNYHLNPGETIKTDTCNDMDVKCAGETSTNGKIPELIDSNYPVDAKKGGAAQIGSGGAFGLLKNAFTFFGEKHVTEIKDSTDPPPTLDTSTGEMSETQSSLTPKQEPDSSSSHDEEENLHTDFPDLANSQRSSISRPQTPSHPTSLPLPHELKSLFKNYRTLQTHMSMDETIILMELFGRNKLQFLDYVLDSSETVTEDPDIDESILMDIETLLHYHKEILFAPRMRLADAPQEDKEKTRTLIALQKLEMLLERVRETFNLRTSDITRRNHQAEASCVAASCSTHSKDQEMSAEEESRKTVEMAVEKENNGQPSGGTGKEMEAGNERGELERGIEQERGTPVETVNQASHSQLGSPQSREGVTEQILDFVHHLAEDSSTQVHALGRLLIWLKVQVVSSLPDDIRPGPDLYGVPWEPVMFSSLVGLVTVLLFSCRCYNSVKSRMYRSKERRMAQQVAQLLDEKCKVLDTFSTCQQEHDELENSLRDSGVLAQTQKTRQLELKARQLEHAKTELEGDLEQLKNNLDQQRKHRTEQERRIAVLEESMKTFEDETKDLQSLEEQAQTTLKVYSMNSDRLQRNLETSGEETTLLQESNTQLRQQVEGWAERVNELEEEMRRCEVSHSGMLQDVASKDESIMSLTNRLLRMKALDADLAQEGGEEESETSNGSAGRGEEKVQKVQKLIYAAKLNADLKSVDEDKDRVFAKLNDEVKAKEDLQVSIKELENERLSMQSDTEHYSDQVQRLQQKLQIMTEMYQDNELKLHRMLTVEEKERLQKEEKLNKADKNIVLAMEELNNYRLRAGEMEEELDKTKQSYQTQISAHEKKAHNNWLAARAADRDLADIRRENALLRQKLTDTQFKLDTLDKDLYALDSLARPLPFRAERSPYGPSPLGRPGSETRALLSPPTLMDGPPARLSPRVSRSAMEPSVVQGDMEQSGGPHSDSGSISPSWERDRRGPMPGPPGPLGPQGYMFQEPGGPMYRRPAPPPGVMGLGPPLPHPRGPPPAGPLGPIHPADMADGAYRENSFGPGEQDHREPGAYDRRTPPESDPRMGGMPPPGPPMGPIDGPFPRRAPYGPPPPHFYPPRGPGGPPMMPMWAPPPPGMMVPPRFPPGGPPHPHMSPYGPRMRPPPQDGPPPSMGLPPSQQSLPSLPHSQSSDEHTPSPQDAI